MFQALLAAVIRSQLSLTPWLRSVGAAAAAALLACFASAGTAAAHPHVWVNAESTVLYKDGRIVGLKHRWTFDEMYSTMAIEGLDTNKDGVYSREELAELAKVNMEGLKEFGYFTYAKLGTADLKLKEPTDYWLEVDKQGALTLIFTVEFADALLAEAEGFAFSVADPSFFIAFELAKDDPVKLAGAPAGCKVTVGIPEKDAEELKRLNESFGGALTAGNANAGSGMGYAKTAFVTCAKS